MKEYEENFNEEHFDNLSNEVEGDDSVELSDEEFNRLLDTLKKEDEVQYYALMEAVTRKKELKHIKEMNEMAENIEKEQKITDLNKSIDNDFNKDKITDEDFDKDDNTGGYRHTAEIARQIKEEEIKKREEALVIKNGSNFKNKKGKWRRGWDSIQDRFLSK